VEDSTKDARRYEAKEEIKDYLALEKIGYKTKK